MNGNRSVLSRASLFFGVCVCSGVCRAGGGEMLVDTTLNLLRELKYKQEKEL